MSLPLFFLDDQVLGEVSSQVFPLRLNEADKKHFKVLRLKVGEHLAVVDAARDYFECELTDNNWDDPQIRICGKEEDPEQGPTVVLVQGLAKGDKMDTVVRQSTEVGVSAVIAMPFRRSIPEFGNKQEAFKLERWRTIARSAAMQSGRMNIPQIELFHDLEELADMARQASCLLVFWEEAPLDSHFAEALHAALAKQFIPSKDARVMVVVGPEGGIEAGEVDRLLAMNNHAFAVTLGKNILRTETAGVMAPALVLYELGALS